jgi:hypothetical protein
MQQEGSSVTPVTTNAANLQALQISGVTPTPSLSSMIGSYPHT